ncbi:hypothetical protein CAEBREN_28296 [Caenorhabditis brenneri]|uniref:Uncharacterized protein n=1 Tax=Caenorhabditis brenneri TaxID=135651 RepID=G0NR02_CAEBE|nr:hypothetical protein CAEBREN_28296 [Caenorhabditis brenneri]
MYELSLHQHPKKMKSFIYF